MNNPYEISEEMLGAYLEGNLEGNDLKLVEFALSDDPELQELADDAYALEIEEPPYYPDLDEVELPMVVEEDVIEIDDFIMADAEYAMADEYEAAPEESPLFEQEEDIVVAAESEEQADQAEDFGLDASCGNTDGEEQWPPQYCDEGLDA